MRPPSPPVRKNGAEAVVAEDNDAAVGAYNIILEFLQNSFGIRTQFLLELPLDRWIHL